MEYRAYLKWFQNKTQYLLRKQIKRIREPDLDRMVACQEN